ncbi:MAG: hypothetical protein HZB25_07470 [Candidatus Eisenbacteria bacterium]|nr:hypothetical protein [Candidatus Eisenbacteria bacterium]
MTPPREPDFETLSSWLDGELDLARRAEVDAWLAERPGKRAELERTRARERAAAQLPEAPPTLDLNEFSNRVWAEVDRQREHASGRGFLGGRVVRPGREGRGWSFAARALWVPLAAAAVFLVVLKTGPGAPRVSPDGGRLRDVAAPSPAAESTQKSHPMTVQALPTPRAKAPAEQESAAPSQALESSRHTPDLESSPRTRALQPGPTAAASPLDEDLNLTAGSPPASSTVEAMRAWLAAVAAGDAPGDAAARGFAAKAKPASEAPPRDSLVAKEALWRAAVARDTSDEISRAALCWSLTERALRDRHPADCTRARAELARALALPRGRLRPFLESCLARLGAGCELPPLPSPGVRR